MTGDTKQAAMDEQEDDFDGPICGLSRKPSKKELIPKDERDDDNASPALSKAQKKRPSVSPKLEKQDPDDDGDEKPPKKKEVLKKKPKSKSAKKEVDSEEEEEEDGKLSKKSRKRKRMEVKKTAVKVKKVSVSQEKIRSDKKIKKQYQLPGQKHEPPEMRDPLRIFYESLYEKVPTSEMAATWLMEWGLLPPEEAEKVYAKKLRKHHIQKFSSPVKATPVKKKSPAISVKKQAKVTSKTTTKKTKKNFGNLEADDDDCHGEKTTPAMKSRALSVKKQVKVTSKTTAKKTKKNLSDSEADEDDDDFVVTKRKLGNRKAST